MSSIAASSRRAADSATRSRWVNLRRCVELFAATQIDAIVVNDSSPPGGKTTMAIATRDRLAGPTAPRELAVPRENKTSPVVMWAVLGGAVLVFLAYVLIAWVAGPYFERVPQGPSDPPTWMHVELIGWQVLSIPAALYLIYRFVIRPWRRERRIGVDGLLTIAFATLWVQDPWSSAVDHWFVYNTSMVNFGSWAHSLPW